MITYSAFGQDYLIEEFSGDVNAREFMSMKKSQIDETDYFKVSGIVMDLRKANFTFTKQKLRQFFAWIIKNKAILENKSIAVLTKTMNQLNFGYLFMEKMQQNYISVKIEQFSTKKEAYNWLNENRRLKPF